MLSRSLTHQDTHSLGAKVSFARIIFSPEEFSRDIPENIKASASLFFSHQARRICSRPVSPAPHPLAALDQWTPSWTPHIHSWPSSSRRSALCSPMPTFTWGVTRWTSPAGETEHYVTEALPSTSNKILVNISCGFHSAGSPTQIFKNLWISKVLDKITANWSLSTSNSGLLVYSKLCYLCKEKSFSHLLIWQTLGYRHLYKERLHDLAGSLWQRCEGNERVIVCDAFWVMDVRLITIYQWGNLTFLEIPLSPEC